MSPLLAAGSDCPHGASCADVRFSSSLYVAGHRARAERAFESLVSKSGAKPEEWNATILGLGRVIDVDSLTAGSSKTETSKMARSG